LPPQEEDGNRAGCGYGRRGGEKGERRMAVEKVIIIGSGPAGWTAAIYAARANLRPLVFEGNPYHDENRVNGTLPLGQLALTTEVENFPSWPYADSEALALFSKSALPEDRYQNLIQYYEGKTAHHGQRSATGPELMEWCRQQAVNFGTRIISDDIIRVDFKNRPFTVYSREGQTAQAKAVIIATGARANYLGLPSEERFKNNGVSACAVCDGALPRFGNKPLIVVGGGDTAIEEGTYLTKYASTVYVVHRRNELRASKVMAARARSNPKMQFKWNRVLDEVLGNDEDGVTGARLKSTTDGSIETLDVSGVFLGIGHTPNTAFLEGQVVTDKVGYIQWTKPARTWTSVEGVFAAGDVADSYYRQAVTAAGTGCMAALDAERWLAEQDEH
jgi:thioredoxin reductase (NADPH)